MAKLKKKSFQCVRDVNIGVNPDGTYKKTYKKGDKILVPLNCVKLYKELNII